MLMKIKTYHADAFTSKPFAGNPAAVCFSDQKLEADLMHAIARENNLPMTAFLTEKGSDEHGAGFSLRWFSPAGEASLCGHATLASGHILFETGKLDAGLTARFDTRAGLLTARKKDRRVEMDFPAFPHEKIGLDQIPENILTALGQDPVNAAFSEGSYLIELAGEEQVRNTRPDFDLLLKEAPVIITGRGSGEYDFVSRFFAPSHGENEDSVTGSAHCKLAPYWSEKLGKTEFFAWQASARGGELHLRLESDRLILGGEAVTIMEGELLIRHNR